MKLWKIFNCIIPMMGLLAIASVLNYGFTGSYWWVEIDRLDITRGLIVFMAHVLPIAGSAMSLAWWSDQS
jgi:general stress protein CsbA